MCCVDVEKMSVCVLGVVTCSLGKLFIKKLEITST